MVWVSLYRCSRSASKLLTQTCSPHRWCYNSMTLGENCYENSNALKIDLWNHITSKKTVFFTVTVMRASKLSLQNLYIYEWNLGNIIWTSHSCNITHTSNKVISWLFFLKLNVQCSSSSWLWIVSRCLQNSYSYLCVNLIVTLSQTFSSVFSPNWNTALGMTCFVWASEAVWRFSDHLTSSSWKQSITKYITFTSKILCWN
jgi:hypothetical protein